MSIDLRTATWACDLRSPLVASASPLTGELDTARRLEDAGVGAIVLPSLFEEEILNEEIELNRSLEAGTEQFAEALDYFPDVDGVRRRRRPLPAPPRGRSRHQASRAGHRQPQRHVGRAAGSRYARLIAGRRRRRAGAQRLPPGRRPRAARAADMEAADLDAHRRGPGGGRPSRSPSSSARTTPRWPTSPPASSRRAPTGWSCSTASTSRTWTSRRSTWSTASSSAAPGSCACRCAGSPILRPQLGPGVVAGGHLGGPLRHRRAQGADGRRRRGDDDLGAPARRAGARAHGGGRAAGLDGRPRVRVGRPSCAAAPARRPSADPAAFERANYMQTLHSWSTPSELTPTAAS